MDNLTITTPAALRELVTRSVVTALAEALPPMLRQANQPPYLTKKELMKLTGWSSRTVEYKKAEGKISYVRQGRLCLFPTDQFLEWLQEGFVPANEAA